MVKDYNNYWVRNPADRKLTVRAKVDEYAGCRDGSRQCFGVPDGCVATGDCDAVLAYGASEARHVKAVGPEWRHAVTF